MAAASSSPTVPSPEGDVHDAPNWVLLDVLGYKGDYPKANFAGSTTSTGESIQVSFHTARPPKVSHFCVYSPDLTPAGFAVPPKVISADSDLILFSVSVCRRFRVAPPYCDYFVYRAHPRNPSLDLLPHPYPNSFRDRDVALLSLGDDNEYAVAALTTRYPDEDGMPNKEFNLYRYRSSKAPEGWTSKVVSLAEPLMDKACPFDSALYHDTTKVIIPGRGALGMVGWVDLWRGILVCNVLQQNPMLVDIPLPKPAKGNQIFHRKFCPHIIRDITANLLKDSIKYIEIESLQTKVVGPDQPPDVRQRQCRVPSRAWKATTWSRPIPIVPCEEWRAGCTFDVGNISIDPMHFELLPRLRGTNDNPAEPVLPAHLIGFPTISMDDDDVVYLLYNAYCTGQTDVVIAVDMRNQTLQGFARLDARRDFTLMRNCTSEISKYLSKDEGNFSY